MEIEGAVLDIDYLIGNEGRASIRITVKGSDGKVYDLRDGAFRPYFYLAPSSKVDREELMAVAASDNGIVIKPEAVEQCKRRILGRDEDVFRIIARSPINVPKLSGAMGRFGTCYEYDIPFAKRYAIDKDITPLSNYTIKVDDGGGPLKIRGMRQSEKQTNIDFNMMCFDIEVYNPLGIPRPNKDPVIMISYTYRSKGKSGSGVLTFKSIKRDFVTVVKDERGLFSAFAKLVRELDIDVIVGYNSANFDIRYMLERARYLGVKFNISRYEGDTRLESHGLVQRVKIGGLVHVDMYQVVKFISIVGAAESILKLNSYTLKNVYEAVSGGKKTTVDKMNIYRLWDGTSKELEELAEYNLSDSYALQEVYDMFIPIMIEMARTTGNVLSDTSVSTTGQLVDYLCMRYANRANEMIPNKPNEGEIKSRLMNPIEGAYVKTPEPGIYENLAIFDFRGLYPSIIISYNIDPATICYDCKEYYESPLGTKFDKKRKGIIPVILKMLIDQRAAVKGQYKKSPDDKFLGARSSALKILSNSFYGYLGYARSRWYSRDCAGSVTAYGRQYIKDTIKAAEDRGFRVIYGDSVGKDSMVKVKRGESLESTPIENLFEYKQFSTGSGKEYYFPDKLYIETLSESGKVAIEKVKYVMRHSANKKMYRVWLTNVTYVDVTEDHSLIGFVGLNKDIGRGKEVMQRLITVKPKEIGDKINSLVIKRKSIRGDIKSREYDKLLYELMGFFIGDGSFHHNKDGKCYYLGVAAGNDEQEILKKLVEPLHAKGIIRNIVKKGRGDLLINGLPLVRLFEKEIMQDGMKRVPKFMYDEKGENIYAFLRGLFSSDGTVIMRNDKPIIRYTTIDENLALQIHSLLLEVGISSSVFKENTENEYKGKRSGTYSRHVNIKSKLPFIQKIGFLIDRKNEIVATYKETGLQKRKITEMEFDISRVKKIEPISYSGYVYDVEVENTHRFFANDVLVHNTDSIVMLLGDKPKEEALGFLKEFNSKLPENMELEVEDFFKRGVFVGRKTESGIAGAKKKYALISESGRIKIRGFELVRRDWSRIARDTQRKVLEAILQEGSAEKAADIVKQVVRNLKEGKVPLSELAINTQLRKGIDSYDSKSPELGAARKAVKAGLKTRDEVESAVISYVITRHGSTISDKAELEEFAKDYDPDYYINNQVIPATMRILKELNFNEDELKGLGTQKKL